MDDDPTPSASEAVTDAPPFQLQTVRTVAGTVGGDDRSAGAPTSSELASVGSSLGGCTLHGVGAPKKGKAMNWREHIRIIALIVNGLSIMFLIGARGWWITLGFGVPFIVAPVLAVIALAVNRTQHGG
jgi:hypothetical protein